MALRTRKGRATENPMRFGAVAILDALGFKGMWGRYDPRELAHALSAHKQVFKQAERPVEASEGQFTHFRFFCLSDTLVFATVAPQPYADPDSDPAVKQGAQVAVRQSINAVQAAIHLACIEKPTLLFRGCIAAGPVYFDDDYLIGAAVDEAAQYMDEADGAFVWFLPSASRLLNLEYWDKGAITFGVPMHGGRTIEVPVVNPFVALEDPERRAELADTMLATFTDPKRLGGRAPSPELLAKMQNTKRFLDFAQRVMTEGRR